MVRVVDVVLQMDVGGGCAHVFQQRVIGGAAIHQQAHTVGAAAGQAGAGLGQAGELGGIGGFVGVVGVAGHAGATGFTTQLVASDPLRPEHVIDQEAEIGQQGKAEQPAQGRDRLALLQDDPAAQQQQVGQPAQCQHQAQSFSRGQGIPAALQQFRHLPHPYQTPGRRRDRLTRMARWRCQRLDARCNTRACRCNTGVTPRCRVEYGVIAGFFP